MKTKPRHNDTLPILKDEDLKDKMSVFYCDLHRGCIQKKDVYRRMGVGKPRCRIHGIIVDDVTHSPMGHAYREIVKP